MSFLVVHDISDSNPYAILKVTNDSTTQDVIKMALEKTGKLHYKADEFVLVEEVGQITITITSPLPIPITNTITITSPLPIPITNTINIHMTFPTRWTMTAAKCRARGWSGWRRTPCA